MARIPLVSPNDLTSEQRPVYDRIFNGLGSPLVGPLRAVLHIPELADRWQNLGQYWHHHTVLTPKQKEVAVLVTARRWNAQIEWFQHEQRARKAGLDGDVIEAIRLGRPPVFTDGGEHCVYEYARELHGHGQVSQATYAAALAALGRDGVVDLTALMGFYTMVSMMLNAHGIPMQDDVPAPLDVADGQGFTTLPPAVIKNNAAKNK
jgi:4-carboxymuconolactone decarboxylase